MEPFTIKRGDTAPALQATLTSNGAPVDLTGCTPTFVLRAKTGGTVIRRAATVVDAAAGIVRHNWQAGDTAASGVFDAEFEFARAGGEIFTAPSVGYIPVRILDDLR